MDKNLFLSPTAEYRGKPFWALNGKLDKAQLAFQIQCMKKMGFGGAFLHSRTGLVTEYMSDEWLELISFAADELARNGMEAYLYDEDRWPSGTCGGLVTATREFRAKAMNYRTASENRPDNYIATFAIMREIGGISSYRRISSLSEKEKEEEAIDVFYEYMQPDTFYNGYTYVDTMNRHATDRFIELTHERYRKAMGEKFGTVIIGIFTDEPHRNALLNGFARKEPFKERQIPYTYVLFDEFAKRRGYRLEDRLPELWFKLRGEKFSKVMYDYVETALELFLENYAVPYLEWCKKNKLVVTGHVLHEDNLAAQTTMCGSVMRYYEYMDYPGMDNLGERNYAYSVPKLVASVARQLGKPFVLDELYGCTGWQMTFADYKHTGNWQSASGVTLRCPHLSWYTMKGEAKRDYPASILHQSGWYPYFSVVEDYFSRMNVVMKNTQPLCDTAILNPIESVWGLTREGTYVNSFGVTDPLYQKIERQYAELYKTLFLGGAEADYIDEGILAKYGKSHKNALFVGAAEYRKLILSGNLNIRGTTLSLVQKFLAGGGRVYVLGDPPEYLDGMPHDFTGELDGAVFMPFEPEKLLPLVSDGPLPVSLHGGNIIKCARKADDGYFLLLLNAEKEEEADVSVAVETDLVPEVYDMTDGSVRGIEFTRKVPYITLNLHFSPDEAVLLHFSRTAEKTPQPPIMQSLPVPDMFDFELNEPNYLVLDNCSCFADGELLFEGNVLEADGRLREHYGLLRRNNEMIQPWFKAKFFPNADRVYGRVRVVYTFECAARPARISLMTEDARESAITLNGTAVDSSNPSSTELDSCFDIVEIPPESLKIGHNTLEIQFDFYENFNFEGVFLRGDFGVGGAAFDTLIPLPEKLGVGDLAAFGLPYYSGGVTYKIPADGGEYAVRLGEHSCALALLENAPVAFPPFVSKPVRTRGGLNLTLVMTRRNLFGCTAADGSHSMLIKQGLLSKPALFAVKHK